MENKIDGIYLPIETMYDKLREFELRLPRIEIEEVDSLRENWFELMELAEQVREVLLKERRGAFEQELDKQVKVCKNFKALFNFKNEKLFVSYKFWIENFALDSVCLLI